MNSTPLPYPDRNPRRASAIVEPSRGILDRDPAPFVRPEDHAWARMFDALERSRRG